MIEKKHELLSAMHKTCKIEVIKRFEGNHTKANEFCNNCPLWICEEIVEKIEKKLKIADIVESEYPEIIKEINAKV